MGVELMASRWPLRLVSFALAAWYSRLGATRRERPREPRRILIVHHFLLGDTLLLAPLLKKLRVQFPAAEIVVTCRPAFTGLFATRPYGVTALPFDPRDVRTFWPLFRVRGFDLALLPADNRYCWVARALDSRWIVAFEGESAAYKNWFVDEHRRLPNRAMALGDLFAEHLVDGPAPPPFRREDWPRPPAAPFAFPPAPYCVLHLGAGSPLRHWDPQKWRGLIASIEASGMRAVLTAGPGEGRLIRDVDPEARLDSYAGTLSLPQLWGLLAGASAAVSLDTGIAHLARLCGHPLVILFGPGSATLFGGGDFWKDVPERAVTIPKFPCRDGTTLFGRHLPWVEHCFRSPKQCADAKCMRALTAEMVVDALRTTASVPPRRATADEAGGRGPPAD